MPTPPTCWCATSPGWCSGEDYVPGYPRWKGKLAQIRRYSRVCYDAFPEMELLLGENEKKRGNGHAV